MARRSTSPTNNRSSPYKTRLDNVRLKVTGLSNEADKKANLELSFESDAKKHSLTAAPSN